jgi:GNAT superfamily N-acetyltransferase
VAQQLTLLHLDVRSSTARRSRNESGAATIALRRHQAIELPLLARVDSSAFPPGWGLDASGLLEAARATPSSRIRVATAGGQVIGMAISGRSGSASFLQRLAVQPAFQRSGAGTALVRDAVSWARHWRARTMAVNTQHDNEPALALYRRLGFEPSPTPLVVLERPLSGGL